MSDLPSLKETIHAMLKRDTVPSMEAGPLNTDGEERATTEDRAYLTSWLGHAEDSIWSKVLAAAQTYRSRTLSYSWLVWIVLRVNRQAESLRFGTDPILELRRKERQSLLDLAHKAEALAAYYRQLDNPDIVSHYGKFLRPVGELIRLHEQEAATLRRRAGEEPKPTVAPIRQDRRGGRSGLRKRRAFITLMSRELDYAMWDDKVFDFTRIEAVAAFARVAFPEVDLKLVRKTLEPTTREGRAHRRAARAQKPQPGPPEEAGLA